MRIVGGQYKGRRYDGAIPGEVRPTTDNVRESIFNILANYIDFEGLTVADICAGTGFMGFEALSRGAGKCYYFEKSKKVIELIKKITELIKIPSEQFQIIPGDAIKKIIAFSQDNPTIKFDLIFFDPPYQGGIFDSIIKTVTESGIANDDCTFVIEHSGESKITLPDTWNILTERQYGSTGVIIAEYNSE